MAKQRAPLEFNTISGGLITEASAITFPDSASLDEDNFELNRDGTRTRRLGVDYEVDHKFFETGILYEQTSVASSSFLWENVAGNNGETVIVIQYGLNLAFYRASGSSLSSTRIDYKFTASGIGGKAKVFGFANIGGKLWVADSSKKVYTITADLSDPTIITMTSTSASLEIRDLFGVPSLYNSSVEGHGGGQVDLNDSAYLVKRPLPSGLIISLYKYNLRNQSFALKKYEKTGTSKTDPISSFLNNSGGVYPSMGDSVLAAYYNNVNDDDNKTVERFHAEDLVANTQGSFASAKGYFIIDALDRSESRAKRWLELTQDQGYSPNSGVSLPYDSTPGGASTIAEYVGRVWYAGFSEDGAATSTGIRLGSYVLYSQLSNSVTSLTRCYQAGDPTSKDAPELLDTDGGFLSLDGAYGITKIIVVGDSLLVFADNGVWAISGEAGASFTPTLPRVMKITDRGSVSRQAIVLVDKSIMYWAKSGIYLITVSPVGDYEIKSVTENTIQTLYNKIPITEKETVIGGYDSYTSQVTWSVFNTVGRTSNTYLLKLLTTNGAFTTHTISDGEGAGKTLMGPVDVPTYTLNNTEEYVVVGLDRVLVGLEQVTLTSELKEARSRDTKYLMTEDVNGYGSITFAEFTQTYYKDWGETDAPAYIVTGYVSGGDFQRHKQIPYITFHFQKTETGFGQLCDGTIISSQESSCLVQAQWDWANTASSGRWGREFQAYRYRSQFMPLSAGSSRDTGFSTVVTKSKIRGKGRVLSLKLSTEAGKDCRILGWSAIMAVNGNV